MLAQFPACIAQLEGLEFKFANSSFAADDLAITSNMLVSSQANAKFLMIYFSQDISKPL